MERKFLAFSCLVLLSSIIYFFYTSYQLRVEIKNQQEGTTELEVPSVERIYTNNSSQSSKLEHTNPEPIQEEWETFEEVLRDFEELEKMAETSQLEGVAEPAAIAADKGRTGISPELEALFTKVRDIKAQQRALTDEFAPFIVDRAELKYRLIEIISSDLVEAGREQTKKLHEEMEHIYQRSVTLNPLVDSYDQQIQQLRYEFEQEYGMSIEEFHEIYDSAYNSWIDKQG